MSKAVCQGLQIHLCISSSKPTDESGFIITCPYYERGKWAWRGQVIRPRSLSSEWIDMGSRFGPGVGWAGLKILKLSSELCVCVWASMLFTFFSAGGGGLGCGKFPWFSLDSWRLSGRRSNPAPSESRRLAWQLPVVSHLPNGGTKQMLHFLLCGQMYWTGSSNLKTKQRRLNLWKTCPVRKITFIRNQLILCLFIFLNFPI